MFLLRFGKQKLSYTLTIEIKKLKYTDLSALSSHNQIQIIIKRGNHERKYVSTINKKGQIACDKKAQSIPMTLYYDKDSKQFDKKEMIIQGMVLNELGETEVELGEAELNIAQNAKEQGSESFVLQVELEGNQKQVCTIRFNVTLQRKFVQNGHNWDTTSQTITERSHSGSRKSPQNKTKKPKDTTLKQPSKKPIDQSTNEPTNHRPNSKAPNNYNEPFLKPNFNQKPKPKYQTNGIQISKTEKGKSPPNRQFQPFSQNNQPIAFDPPVPTLQRPKVNNNTASTDLKIYELENLLKVKDKELAKVRIILEDQRKINEALLEQQRKEIKHTQSYKLTKELDNLRTQLQVANMKISHLQSANRSHLEQAEASQLAADRQAQQIAFYKGQLQREKIKVAELFQKALQSGDNALISFLEEGMASDD